MPRDIYLRERKVIYNTYDNFKKFVEVEKLPDFKLDIIGGKKCKELKYYAQVRFVDENIILSVNADALKKKELGSILYHEFTHIYDYFVLPDMENKVHKISLYSEYHATQIEFIKKHKLIEKLSDNISGAELFNTQPAMMDKLMKEAIHLAESFADKVKTNHEGKTKFDLRKAYFYYLGASDLLFQTFGIGRRAVKYYRSDKRDDYDRIHNYLQNIKYNESPNIELIETISKLY